MGIITGALIGSIVGFIGVTSKQTKDLAEYLTSKDATNESKAITLPDDIAKKYMFALLIPSGFKIKKTKDKKYWVA